MGKKVKMDVTGQATAARVTGGDVQICGFVEDGLAVAKGRRLQVSLPRKAGELRQLAALLVRQADHIDRAEWVRPELRVVQAGQADRANYMQSAD